MHTLQNFCPNHAYSLKTQFAFWIVLIITLSFFLEVIRITTKKTLRTYLYFNSVKHSINALPSNGAFRQLDKLWNNNQF